MSISHEQSMLCIVWPHCAPPIADVGQHMHPKVPKQQQAMLNRKMFLMFCMNSIPFNVADSPYFLDFILEPQQVFPACR